MYRLHDVTINGKYRDEANTIIKKHIDAGDIDKIYAARDYVKGNITYWITPYIYEDLETIMDEFKEAGIQIL